VIDFTGKIIWIKAASSLASFSLSLVISFRSGYFALRSLGEGGLKKSECESESEHTRFFFLKTHCSTFFLKNLSFLSELQQEIILFKGFLTSGNIPGGYLKIIHQIRSKGFLDIKPLDPLLVFSHQKIVRFFRSKF